MTGVRPGVRVGLDVGRVRVGVARTDVSGVLAVPVTALARGARTHIADVVTLVGEYQPLEVVIGLPLSLDGSRGPAAEEVSAYARDLACALAAAGRDVPIRLVDERLSTVTAARDLRGAGHDARSSRALIDAQAAVVIVSHALDVERGTGVPAGELLGASGTT